MKTKVFALDGKQAKDIELLDEVFNIDISQGSIYHAIKNELANMRLGTANTKSRSEVKGSGRKRWRQKGTGRARAGTTKSPICVGGGVAFGPKPRDYSYRLPKKLKRLAMKSILSLKLKEQRLKVIEDFSIDSGKTKELITILKNIISKERTVIVLGNDNNMLKRAGSNVVWLSFLSFNRLRAHDIFYSKNLLILESAALKLNDFYRNRKIRSEEEIANG